MDEFQSEKEQIEEIKKWWKENGGFVTIGLVLGVLVLGGWKYWGHYKVTRAETASAAYQELLQTVKTVKDNPEADLSHAADLETRLTDEFASTPYASMASLAMGQLYVSRGDAAEAATALRRVVDLSRDDQLKLVARLRLAKVLLMQEQPADAVAMLDGVDPGIFSARFHDVRGDAYVQLGQAADARREYKAALDKYEPGLFDRQFVEMKLDDLAVVEPDA